MILYKVDSGMTTSGKWYRYGIGRYSLVTEMNYIVP